MESINKKKTHIRKRDALQNVTVYLAEKSKITFDKMYKEYFITYDTVSESNLVEFPEQMQTHEHEETDGLMISHFRYVAKRDS